VVIDTHDHPICDAVWDLYRVAILRLGRVPTLIERDAKVPPLAVLLAEAEAAERILEDPRAAA
jgi:uncharacterized protein (UPF0276 family)